ncbi:MAG: dephospho-CoA kinase [Alphaproteobacteria bacterium]|nr:dephospho-CoA kinase [Alphaproteobacteria bacterium]MDC3311023.1 dephospho-CoA kinase [Alphaproteobacteria bacterium]
MKIIGLTGSIASGKSSVSQMFRHLGIPVHDADKTVHELMGAYGLAVPELLSIFGNIGSVDQGINRKKLGEIVFSDESAKYELESIIHPLVWRDRNKFLEQMRHNRKKVIIVDIPLLFETGSNVICNKVICVWAPIFLLRQRALKRAGMTSDKLNAILHHQLPQYEKMRLADFCLPSGLGKAYSFKLLKRWLITQR